MALSGAGFSEESQETGIRVELEGHLSCFSCLFQAQDPQLGLLNFQTPLSDSPPSFSASDLPRQVGSKQPRDPEDLTSRSFCWAVSSHHGS